MNVWIVSEGEPLPIDSTSVRLRRMGILAKLLIENNHNVTWFSSNFHHYKKVFRSKGSKVVKINKKYTIQLLNTKGYKKNISYARIKHHKIIAKNFIVESARHVKPDIIITTMAPLELSKKAVEFGKMNNIPVIVDIRDLWPEIYREVVPQKLKILISPYIKYKKRILAKILNNSTSIIGVTPNFLEYGLNISNHQLREEDRVFYTSYEPKNYSDYKKYFQENWGRFDLSQEDFIVTFIGNFGKQFNLNPLSDAIERLEKYTNIKFVLCGNGDKLEDFKENFKKNPNVILPGWIEEEQISSLLSMSSIGVAPYRDSVNFRDNTPNKFGEYLSASLPILVGIEGIMKDLLIENKCGYKYNDGRDLSNKILEIYNDESLNKLLKKNSGKLFNKNFNANNTYKNLIEFMQLISNKKKMVK